MTKHQIETRLGALGLRLERAPGLYVQGDGGGWIARWTVRPDTMAKEVIPLRRLADAEDVIDIREIMRREG